MAEERLGASFSIDVTDLKTGLTQANRLIRESESEFKSASAGMDDWTQSQEGLTAKIKSLSSITDLQRKKIGALNQEYDRLIREGLDPTSREAVELRTKINNETAALNKSEKELAKQKDALKNLSKETKDTAKETEKVGKSFEGLKTAAKVAVGAIAAVGAACVAGVGKFLSLAESTRETREEMNKLDTAFQQAGFSAGVAEKAYTTFNALLGDTGKSTETLQHLAMFAETEQELADYTDILTGVYTKFGESLPTEGLAEAINHTIQVGSVQANLADALEWSGVSVDDFNARLAECSTEQERNALINKTLTGLYGEAAAQFKETNKDILEAKEAETELALATAELGKIAEPIMTRLKRVATALLTAITPFVKLIGEGLTDAMNGADGAAEKLSEGLGGILKTLSDKAMEILPTVLSVISGIIPKLISSVVEKIPTLIQSLTEIIPQIMTAMYNAYPALVVAVTKIIVSVAEGLKTMLPQIVDALLDVIPAVIDALLAAIPELLEAAVSFFMAIIDALPVIIDKILEALPTIINAVLNSLISAIPDLIQAAIQLFNAIIEAIPVIIQSLTEALPTIINAIIDGLLEALPLLLDGAIQLLMAIVEAIPTIIQVLSVQIPGIVRTIITTLLRRTPDLIKGAFTLFMGIVKAIPSFITELILNLPEIITTIVEGLADGIGDVAEVGKDLVKGLWEGIKDMGEWIGKKIKGFGEGVLGGLKDFFGIESPSKVMENVVGKNLALGIGKGFSKNIGAVNDEITEAMNPTVNVNGQPGIKSGGGVTIYQTNNYAQAHTRYELYKSKQQTANAVRLAMGGVV